MTESAQILILDPDDQTAADCILAFEKRGWHADWGHTFGEARELVRRQYYDVAVIELVLPDIEGTEAWDTIRKVSPSTIGIMMTSSVSLRTSVYALEPGILAYLQKPLNLTELSDLIGQALRPQHEFREGGNVERRLAGLNNLLSSITHAADPDHILNKTLIHLQGVLQFDWAALYLLAEDRLSWKELVQPRLLAEKKELTASQREFILQRSIEVTNSLQPEFLAQSGTLEFEERTSTLQQLGLRELALVPLIGPEGPAGVLAVINGMDSKTALEPADIQLLTIVSQAVGLALNRARLAKELQAEAIHDPATGACTSAYLDRLIEIETARWKRYARPFSLVIIDTANLERSFAEDGKQGGRHKRQDVVNIAQSLLRRSDVVALLSDWEVGILLSDTPLEGAQHLVGRVTKAIQEQLAARCTTSIPTIQTRVVVPSNEANSLNDLLRSAHA